ncbi:ubiquinone/menaquinone biosynthesis methyltransferase [Thecamonas trahens ATCC 50062]|uniref:Ubiquinone/menaquinone biosynthesis methyltransferase n=1 Tax=Thecamonas trahens ATCC 50062 TaxID=461836 RepID=A0A0L0DGF7_THETB|nr:ubiquinone/menaquinone biosynthesis methyltransferase [Thecamonas trahens ATCC 50062]KNC51270.1 ubiquinone/menaquinone biosynthesis methyltransferase [Thecamonas trahens ATCC 50062]|eukprot:XP_013756198.1 ubiquinone/menaquinone biosynthesis methyltransferase [Thecamonas trahens ATCC 50062]
MEWIPTLACATGASLAYLTLPRSGPTSAGSVLPLLALATTAAVTAIHAHAVELTTVPNLALALRADPGYSLASLLAIWAFVFAVAGAPLAAITTSAKPAALLAQIPLALATAARDVMAVAAGSTTLVWAPHVLGAAIAAFAGRSPAGAWAHMAWLALAQLWLLGCGCGADAVSSVSLDASNRDAFAILVLLGAAMIVLRLRLHVDDDEITAVQKLAEMGSAEAYLDEATAKLTYNEALFQVVAPAYDFITKALSFGQDASWKKALISDVSAAVAELAERDEGDEVLRVVDVACGTGDVTFALAKAFPGADVVGTDLSGRMLDLAAERADGEDLDNVYFVQSDMCHMPFEDGAVDLVTGSYALRNAPSIMEALEETNRVLRVGGVAAWLDFCKPDFAPLAWAYYYLLLLWGGLWGVLVHGSPDVYGYIARSLDAYPTETELAVMLEFTGYQVISSKRYFFGFIAVNIVQKLVDGDLLNLVDADTDDELDVARSTSDDEDDGAADDEEYSDEDGDVVLRE